MTAFDIVWISLTAICERMGGHRSTWLERIRDKDVAVLRRRDGYWVDVEDFKAKLFRNARSVTKFESR